MKYEKVVKGKFISRPNRFIAQVEIDGAEETVHVKNTGRCRELLVFGCTVYLETSSNPARKTKYDLIAVEKVTERGTILINMDSQVVNGAVEEWLKDRNLFGADAEVKREVTYGRSRFDFCINAPDKVFLEVKGVTLESDGVARFPDAPTERGVKHIEELTAYAEDGGRAYILFVVQMKGVHKMMPNDATDPKFANALRRAADAGVRVLCYDCVVTPDEIKIDREVAVELLEIDY